MARGLGPTRLAETQLVHHPFGGANLLRRYTAIGLAQVPHDRKGRVEKGGVIPGAAEPAATAGNPIRVHQMAKDQADQCADRPANHKAKDASDDLAANAHEGLSIPPLWI